MMFAFSTYIPTHSHCCNPFGATIANPRINFALGIAAATAMPVYNPCLPVFGFGFNLYNPFAFAQVYRPVYPQAPGFGYLTTQNYALNNLNAINSFNYYNRQGFQFNPTTLYNNSFGSTSTYNNFNKIDLTSILSPSLNNNSTLTGSSSTTQPESINTNGIRLNRNNADYGPEFLAKVKEIAKRLNCDYRDLLGLMNSESGIRADIKNPNGSASGLIQFIESTAKSLGTTTAELRAMKPIDQLDYVERYLTNAKRNAGISGKLSAGDLYTLVFLPGRINRNVVTSSGEDYYAKNKGLDLNNDGQITKTELGQRIHNKRVSDNSFLA
jgi:hypothetical protein